MISVRGHEFECDPYDLDDMAKKSAADTALQIALAAAGAGDPGIDPDSDQLEAIFAAYTSYFDAVLGKGSLGELLGGKRNPVRAIELYYELRNAQLEAMFADAAEAAQKAPIPSKYDPSRIRK